MNQVHSLCCRKDGCRCRQTFKNTLFLGNNINNTKHKKIIILFQLITMIDDGDVNY